LQNPKYSIPSLEPISNSLSISHKKEDQKPLTIVPISEEASYIITVSDGYDKLKDNIPTTDKIITDLITSGANANMIQNDIKNLWESELKKAGAKDNGFGADDFSFVCAQVLTPSEATKSND